MWIVEVKATWESHERFEFATEEEANEFHSKVEGGGSEGLDAIVEAGDITSANAEIMDYDTAGFPRESDGWT